MVLFHELVGLTTGAVTGLVVEPTDHPERAAVTEQVFGPLRSETADVVEMPSTEEGM